MQLQITAAVKFFFHIFIAVCLYGNIAQAQNTWIAEQQNNILRNTGITRKEGMDAYKIMMQCKQRGFPSSNRWNRCMQPTYVIQGIPLPSSVIGAVSFAVLQECAHLMNDAELMMCAMSKD